MKNKIIGIYKIVSPNNRVYIGQSRNIYKRWGSYKSPKTIKQPRLYSSILKYGIENHIFEVIEECEIEQLNIRERYWQEFYNVMSEEGLNCTLTPTDESPKEISEETRKKLRLSKLGENNPMYGKTPSEETKQLISEKNKERYKDKENHPMFGRTFSREKGGFKGNKNPFYGKKHTQETMEKINKKVIDTHTGIIYKSLKQASEVSNIKIATLSAYLLGKRNNKTTFLYVCEVDKLINFYRE